MAKGLGQGCSPARRAVVPLPNAEFLDQWLPISRLVIIDAGHFVWEEEPKEYASTVLDSLTGNWP
jgi:pimeloyl-ACP methyl ester carboxylesterase